MSGRLGRLTADELRFNLRDLLWTCIGECEDAELLAVAAAGYGAYVFRLPVAAGEFSVGETALEVQEPPEREGGVRRQQTRVIVVPVRNRVYERQAAHSVVSTAFVETVPLPKRVQTG